ncbi:MAG TPA: D-arabinono-1,4-lactone oxidase, partial [Actinotalea sp.]|nr:D-arabinono-1,4-lactone oxidase [Actinotalea sp.]
DIITNERDLRFDEMEYMLPLEVGLRCFDVIRERIKERHRQKVGWRVLVRTVAPDEAMLSNCYQRPTMTIALLQNNELPHDEYFADLEPILQEFGGRPHWGKKHSMRAEQLSGISPEWDAFHAIRRRLDPDGVFQNDFMRELFEEDDR